MQLEPEPFMFKQITLEGFWLLKQNAVPPEKWRIMVGELVKGQINEYNLHPGELGLELDDRRAIEVHTVAESKAMIQAVLEGQPGPAQNIVALNAGAAIYVAGVAKTFKSGIERAVHAIRSGAAKQKLEEFVAFTQKVKAHA